MIADAVRFWFCLNQVKIFLLRVVLGGRTINSKPSGTAAPGNSECCMQNAENVSEAHAASATNTPQPRLPNQWSLARAKDDDTHVGALLLQVDGNAGINEALTTFAGTEVACM